MKNKLNVLCAAVLASTLVACASPSNSAKDAANDGLIGSTTTAIEYTKAEVSADFIKGADISTLIDMEKSGFVFKDENGNPKDCLQILKDNGVNYIRLRLWNDPKDENGNYYGAGNNDLATDIAIAKRAKALGMKFLLDFHYSDFWTDPGKQIKPKAWEKLSFEELNTAIYDYTKSVVKELKAQGVMPDMVQIGNEINSGILWPEGKSWGGDGHEFDRLSQLLKSAIKGFNEGKGDSVCPVMLHLAKGTDNGAFKWWFDEITKRDVQFDLIGMSMYTWWDGSIPTLQSNIDWVEKQYHKDVIVVEGGYPYSLENDDNLGPDIDEEGVKKSGYAATVNGQYLYLKDLMQGIDKVGGKGFFYWEPAWKTGEGITWSTPAGMKYINCGAECQMGNSRENQALFDKDGKVLPSIKVFNN